MMTQFGRLADVLIGIIFIIFFFENGKIFCGVRRTMLITKNLFGQVFKDSHVNLANFVPCYYSAIMDLESQGRIQTKSSYASAEITSAVVKSFKKYWNTRFLHQIIFFFSSANRKE